MFSSDDILDNDLLSLHLASPSSTVSSFLSPIGSPDPSHTIPETASPSTSTSCGKLYQGTHDSMTLNDFRKWNVTQLSEYLADRCKNKSGNKEKLVTNVYGAYMQNLPATFTDIQQEKEQIELDIKAKLVIEKGMVNLPNPSSIVDNCRVIISYYFY